MIYFKEPNEMNSPYNDAVFTIKPLLCSPKPDSKVKV